MHWVGGLPHLLRSAEQGLRGALDPDKQTAFSPDILELIERGNRSGDGSLVLPSEYLEVVIDL